MYPSELIIFHEPFITAVSIYLAYWGDRKLFNPGFEREDLLLSEARVDDVAYAFDGQRCFRNVRGYHDLKSNTARMNYT